MLKFRWGYVFLRLWSRVRNVKQNWILKVNTVFCLTPVSAPTSIFTSFSPSEWAHTAQCFSAICRLNHKQHFIFILALQTHAHEGFVYISPMCPKFISAFRAGKQEPSYGSISAETPFQEHFFLFWNTFYTRRGIK